MPSPSENKENSAAPSNRSLRRFAALLHDSGKEASFQEVSLRLSIQRSNGEAAEISLPATAFPRFASLLAELSQDKAAAMVTPETEVSTQQAADFMNVSRPYVVKLVEQGQIPARKVGVRRRVRWGDVLRYMEETGNAASSALNEMAAENQRLGLYPPAEP